LDNHPRPVLPPQSRAAKEDLGFVREDQRRYAREDIENGFDLLAACPRLARVHVLNAAAERPERAVSREDSFGSRTKRIDDRSPICRVQEKNGANLGMQVAQPAYDLKANQRAVLKVGADQRDIGLTALCLRKNPPFFNSLLEEFRWTPCDGVSDMAGNVWEMTSGNYQGDSKAMRGGSFLNPLGDVRGTVRWAASDEDRGAVWLGFRCVMDAANWSQFARSK